MHAVILTLNAEDRAPDERKVEETPVRVTKHEAEQLHHQGILILRRRAVILKIWTRQGGDIGGTQTRAVMPSSSCFPLSMARQHSFSTTTGRDWRRSMKLISMQQCGGKARHVYCTFAVNLIGQEPVHLREGLSCSFCPFCSFLLIFAFFFPFLVR